MFGTLCVPTFITFLSSAVFVVGYIQTSNLFPEPLSSSEEAYFLDKFKNGDIEARNILIERNLRLVAHVAKKYSSSNIEQDDLISIGTIGLIKGINSFKDDKGVKLSTYVARCIDNEILMFLRSSKKLQSEVKLNDPIGKDKDDNVVTLQEVLEADIRSIEDQVDLGLKTREFDSLKNLKFLYSYSPNSFRVKSLFIFLRTSCNSLLSSVLRLYNFHTFFSILYNHCKY